MEEENVFKISSTSKLPKLISIGELFSGATKVYLSRFGLFFGISILPVFIGSVGKIITFYYSSDILPVPILLLVIVLFLISSFLNILSILAVMYVISRPVTILEAYAFSLTKLVSFIWLGILNTLMILGGLAFFVIPGVIVGVWMSFSSFILIYENLKGFDSLLKSKAYVRGYLFQVFGRIIIPMIIILCFSFLVGVLFGFGSDLIESVISGRSYKFISQTLIQIISALFFPFIMIYQYLLYRDLASKKINLISTQPKENKKLFIFICALGIIAIPVFISIQHLIGVPLGSGMLRDERRYSDLLQIQSRIQLYQQEHKQYPISLDELTPDYFKVTPKDPLTGSSYNYKIIFDGNGYEVCSKLESTLIPACIISSSTISNK